MGTQADGDVIRVLVSSDNHLVSACKTHLNTASSSRATPAHMHAELHMHTKLQSRDPRKTLACVHAPFHKQGVWEKDQIRKHDSFVAFEEVLKQAQELNVDLVLLGGDLFHENKPSRRYARPCFVQNLV